MEYHTFARSQSLNNISDRKLSMILDAISNKENASVISTAYMRYAESNIPIEYWGKSMEKHFTGNPVLLDCYVSYTNDLKKSFVSGRSFCLAGPHGVGKQLCLDTDVPTTNGFFKLKELKEGDQLFDENGNKCKILKLHPIQISPESYRVFFDDGSTVDACADHRWLTYTRTNRVKNTEPTVKTTKEILNTLKFKNGTRYAANHSIKCCSPLQYDKKNLKIDPYVLGCWLGDEHSNIGDHNIGILKEQLQELNLLKNKHIPIDYIYSSYEQRLELIQGIMDTNGCCLKRGLIEYCSINKRLADDVCLILNSFGIKCKVKENKTILNGKICKNRFHITFASKLPVFKLQKKLNNIKLNKSQINRIEHRYIVDIQRIPSKPMRCITVDSPSHLFLVSKNFIPTHNTMSTCSILKKACEKGYNALYTTLSDVVHVITKASNNEVFIARKELMEVDFLVIDELDPRFMATENATDLFARSLESVFRTRSQNKMPTLMCTNSPNLLSTFNGSLKESLSSIMNNIENIIVMDEDFRKNNKNYKAESNE